MATEPMTQQQQLPELFVTIGNKLPEDWGTLSPPLQLDSLMKAFNSVVTPKETWLLVNGDMTLVELLDLKS